MHSICQFTTKHEFRAASFVIPRTLGYARESELINRSNGIGPTENKKHSKMNNLDRQIFRGADDGLDGPALPVPPSPADAPRAAVHRDGDERGDHAWRPRAAAWAFIRIEHPVALQLGGSDPAELAEAARIGDSVRLRRDQPQCRLSRPTACSRAASARA